MRLSIGNVYNHPTDGPVYINGGSFFGDHGISNWWYWNKINSDGTLGESGSGYGGQWQKLDAKVTVTVKLA